MQELTEKKSIKRFQLQQFDSWYDYLLTQGCVVIKHILTQQQVKCVQDDFWAWIQGLGNGIKRHDTSTWRNQQWLGLNQMGFFVTYGGCHTAAAWMIRTNPKVKQAFSKIWKTQNLIASFDTFISWRPWWESLDSKKWHPCVQNLHLDQNPSFKKGLKCVQGMVALKKVRQNQVGGLQVVPKSNSQQIQQQIISRYPYTTQDCSDWVELRNNDPLMGAGVLVECDAGDLILWDSRTVHGGKICQPNGQFKEKHKNQLVRLAATVTMVPREWCSQGNRKLRMKYFNQKIGTTHWPQESLKNSMGKMILGFDKQKITYKFPQLNAQIEELI